MTLAVAANDLQQDEPTDGPLGAVQRALSRLPRELVLRVRARIQAYEAADETSLPRSALSHVDADFERDDIDQVLELLVDLRELGPRHWKGPIYRILPRS